MAGRPHAWKRLAWLAAIVLVAVVIPSVARADAPGSGADAHDRAPLPMIWWVGPVGALLALLFAWLFYKAVMRADEGDPDMQEIAAYVREGAYAYLRRQYKVVAIFFAVVSALLALMAFGFHTQHKIVFLAFLTGGFFSGLCGFLGMKTATNASHRTAAAARESLNRGLVVAFRSGAVMGLVVVGFGLVDICMWFLALYYLAPRLGAEMTLTEISVVMLCFGMGASSQALFARVGGGIYTKAADVGADLVGKVEAGIPEDDPRNPATIADNVGDNVGDVAGMGADLYESYCGSILATMALGVAGAASMAGVLGEHVLAWQLKLLSAPIVLAGAGIALSIVGIFMVRTKEGATMRNLLRSLLTGVLGSSVMIAVVALLICLVLFRDAPDGAVIRPVGIWGSIMAGLIAGLLIGQATEYYTSYEYKPTRGISEQALTGPATVIIAGIAEGMKSTWAALATIIVAIMCAFGFAGGFDEITMGLYGVGIAAVGMLSTLGITLATDAYGPIADNAGGNAEMTGQPPHVRERTDALDSLGNTTAATGKGFAIGSAALTALALLAAYVEEVRVGQNREAQAYVVSRIPEAARSAEAGVGRTFYIGHGKFAHKRSAGTGIRNFEALMLLSKVPDELRAGDEIRLTGQPGEDHVWSVPFERAGKKRVLRLVPAPKASLPQYMAFYRVTLMNPKVLCGLLAGVLLAFLFCSLTMKAVGRSANRMMLECRDQFDKIREWMRREGRSEDEIADPNKWPKRVEFEGHLYPDYARCVRIATAGAQREMIFPSLLAVITPVLVGLVFDVGGVMALLAGGLSSGFALAIFMANAGGAWDNAKKWIETGQLGGKGSDAHKAGVVGDTVGDPFKDTSGPSLNILIKLMSMVSVVFAGLVVKYAPQIADLMGMG